MALLTATEAKEAMTKAKHAKVDYIAPNADPEEVARSFQNHARHSGLISPT
jgi:hypothetical protein